MKRALTSAMRSGAQGVKIQCGGRLGGGEMSRPEHYSMVASRFTRCAPTSTTASPRRRPRSVASASRSGSTRERSCPRASPTPAAAPWQRRPRRVGRGVTAVTAAATGAGDVTWRRAAAEVLRLMLMPKRTSSASTIAAGAAAFPRATRKSTSASTGSRPSRPGGSPTARSRRAVSPSTGASGVVAGCGSTSSRSCRSRRSRRDPHGLRQGLARGLGGRGQAGQGHVRARRCAGALGPRGHAPGREQAARSPASS